MKSKDTIPEVLLADAFDELHLDYIRHESSLPGTPDIVFPEHRLVVFVHGCYWHRHANCPRASVPKKDSTIWVARFEEMVRRDQRNIQLLVKGGWRVYVAWECDILRSPDSVAAEAARQLHWKQVLATRG